MDAQTALQALSIALMGAMVITYLFWWWARECRCDHCSFHKHERRTAAERKRLEAEAARKHEADRRHEYWHKGAGAMPGDPDLHDCPDPHCRRNSSNADGGTLDT